VNAIGRAGLDGPSTRGDRAERSAGPGAEPLFGGARGGDGTDRPGGRVPFATAPPAGWPAEPERDGAVDPFRRFDQPETPSSSSAAGGSRVSGTERTREWLDRFTGDATPAGQRSDDPERPLPRRAAAEPPRSSLWAPDPWSAAPTGAAGAGWTTGWPGTGTAGRRTDDRDGHDEPAAESANGGGGRRRAEGVGSTRLSVAELAQRAAREATTPRRSRHTRPGADRAD
jgi:hypothetical protein